MSINAQGSSAGSSSGNNYISRQLKTLGISAVVGAALFYGAQYLMAPARPAHKRKVPRAKVPVDVDKAVKLFLELREPHSEVNQADHFFAQIDTDGDGVISMDELKAYMSHLAHDFAAFTDSKAPDDAEVESLLREYDTDGNGVLDRQEFEVFSKRWLHSLFRERNDAIKVDVYDSVNTFLTSHEKTNGFDLISSQFDQADVNRDGHVSLEELKGFLHQISRDYSAFVGIELANADAVALMKQYDTNGNGSLEKDEFRQFCVEFLHMKSTGGLHRQSSLG